MAQTNAPPGASTETEELVSQLRDLLAQRRAVLDQIRRGIGHEQRDDILLELCAFRGMQYTEAGAAIGHTREGVARRIRPILEARGLAGLSLFERQRAAGDRPHQDRSTDDLLAHLKPTPADAREAKRHRAREARELRAAMVKLMDKLHKGGMTWVELAAQLDVSVPTIQRLRGTM